MRAALRRTVSRPTLSQFEKAALKYRLMVFLPLAVQRFADFFTRNQAFEQEGVFRIAPPQDLLQGALAQLELLSSRSLTMDIDAAAAACPSFLELDLPSTMGRRRELLINVVASCYKVYFRRMTIRLIPPFIFKQLSKLASGKSKENFVNGIAAVMIQLPPPHTVLLRHTLDLLRRVSEYADVNRMSIDAIARIFVAGLLPAPDFGSNRSMAEMQEDNDLHIWMLKLLIECQDKIFVETDKLIASELAARPNVQLTPDSEVSQCCHDENRWRFFFPENDINMSISAPGKNFVCIAHVIPTSLLLFTDMLHVC